jgi:hypothetical protein
VERVERVEWVEEEAEEGAGAVETTEELVLVAGPLLRSMYQILSKLEESVLQEFPERLQ